MEQKEMSEVIKNIDTKVLKDEAKKLGLKTGHCPTKMSITRMLPGETLRKLADNNNSPVTGRVFLPVHYRHRSSAFTACTLLIS